MAKKNMNFRLERENGGWVIYFEEYIREGFIGRALVIYLDNNDHLIKIFYNSANFGTTLWSPKEGFSQCHSWESEDQAMDGNFLKRMYPAITHNGAESIHFAKMIEKDILSCIDDPEIILYIDHIKQKPHEVIELGRLQSGH